MKRLQTFLVKHKAVLVYLFFGALTTLVNFLVYYPLYNYLHLSATVSNIIAWAAAVVFAFLTNKPLVFNSNDWSMKTVFPEFWKFCACRVGTGVLETLVLFVTVDMLHLGGNIMKIIVSVVVVIVNYVGSKLFVFKK